MPVPKKPDQSSGKTAPEKPVVSSTRKPWKKKTPVEIVIEQEEKLRTEIEEAEQEIKTKKLQLQKFEQARKLFEGT